MELFRLLAIKAKKQRNKQHLESVEIVFYAGIFFATTAAKRRTLWHEIIKPKHLSYMKPNKLFAPTFDKINALNAGGNFKLHTGFALLNKHSINIKKSNKGFDVHLDFKPFKGFTSTKFDNLDLQPPLSIRKKKEKYYLPKHALLLNSYWPTDENLIRLSGGISKISSTENDTDFNEKFLRIVIPVKARKPKIYDIQGYWYDCDIKSSERKLIKVFIHEKEYHYCFFKKNEDVYLIIDSLNKTTFEDFKKVVSNISNAFGFLFGDLFLGEGYFLSSRRKHFKKIENIYYSSYRDSILSGYGIYTTNPYSVYNLTGDTREEIEAQVEEIKKSFPIRTEFDDGLFSKLCQLFYDKEPFSRAAIIILQGNTFALEIKGSAYSIALEAVTEVILKNNNISFPKPIQDEKVFEEIKKEFLEKIGIHFPKKEMKWKDTINILTSRINNLNNPSNADKLKKPFELLGYTLNKYETEVIKHRDLFQHGKLPSNPESEQGIFKDVYYSCMILHRLVYILVLKYIGFEGYIINYPQLHKHITSKDLEEDLLYKI